jgi:drug/metabolite transporter (DMT)-like permease
VNWHCQLHLLGYSTLATSALLRYLLQPSIAHHAWVPTVCGFLLWYTGSARTSGSRASLATVWLPVSALLLSALFLREQIQVWQWVGLDEVCRFNLHRHDGLHRSGAVCGALLMVVQKLWSKNLIELIFKHTSASTEQ